MTALLAALLLCLLLEQGSDAQTTLRARAGHGTAAFAQLITSVVLVAALSGALGAGLTGLLSPDARQLYLAMALLIAALSLFWRLASPKHEEGTRIPGIPALLVRRLGENSAFAISGVATFSGSPLLAAIGGAIGGSIGLLPALTGTSIARGAVQAASGVALCAVGIPLAASALHLL